MNKQEFIECYNNSQILSDRGRHPVDVRELRDRSILYGSTMFEPGNMRFFASRFHNTLYGKHNNVVIWSDKRCFDDYTRVYCVAVYTETVENSGEPYFGNSYKARVERYEERFDSLYMAKKFLKECGIVE